jgi:ABC-2 type transport system permease protein
VTLSLRRIARLARWNAVLLSRNRLTFFYAAVLPLAPLALLFGGERGSEAVGANAVSTVLLAAVLFPVYYNVLSQFVNRRDELVLKRMRTGETRDGELIASIALPGFVIAVVVCALAVPLAAALGQRLPVNPVLYAGAVLAAAVMFTALACWTAAWTRSAESAQLTSLPVILLAAVGPLTVSVPEMSDALRSILERTPGAAMAELVRVGWFGLDGPEAEATTLSFADTWSQAGPPLLVIAAWTALAVTLAKRSMRWEPRA